MNRGYMLRGSRPKRPYYNNLGLRVGTRMTRRAGTDLNRNGDLDKVLYTTRMVRIAYSDVDERLNVRHGRLVNVSGVKLRCWFQLKNQAESSDKFNAPLTVRWAILNPRENNGATNLITGDNFFVSDAPTTDNSANFPSTGVSFNYMNRKINHRVQGVVKEGQFKIWNDPASNNSRVAVTSKKMLNFYIPIKKMMKWSNNNIDTEDAYPNTNLYFVYWYCNMGDNTVSQKYTTTNDAPMDVNAELITYFRNPKITL